jgi:hypothetical protein
LPNDPDSYNQQDQTHANRNLQPAFYGGRNLLQQTGIIDKQRQHLDNCQYQGYGKPLNDTVHSRLLWPERGVKACHDNIEGGQHPISFKAPLINPVTPQRAAGALWQGVPLHSP